LQNHLQELKDDQAAGALQGSLIAAADALERAGELRVSTNRIIPRCILFRRLSITFAVSRKTQHGFLSADVNPGMAASSAFATRTASSS